MGRRVIRRAEGRGKGKGQRGGGITALLRVGHVIIVIPFIIENILKHPCFRSTEDT